MFRQGDQITFTVCDDSPPLAILYNTFILDGMLTEMYDDWAETYGQSTLIIDDPDAEETGWPMQSNDGPTVQIQNKKYGICQL